jgi:hypothetical protein
MKAERAERVVTLFQGLVAGVVLYLTVAVFFAGVNLLAGRSAFHSVELLAEPLLGQRPVVPGPEWRWAARLTFNGVHLAGSLILGVAAAFLAAGAERARRARWVFLLILVVGSILLLLGLQILTADVSQYLPWHSVLTAHLAGAITTTAFLLWVREERRLAERTPGQGNEDGGKQGKPVESGGDPEPG